MRVKDMQIGESLVCSRHGGRVSLTHRMKTAQCRVCDDCIKAYSRKWSKAQANASLAARQERRRDGVEHAHDEKETWAAVPGAPGYEASTAGRVRSIDRQLVCGRRCLGTVLRPYITGRGYRLVRLRINGKTASKSVHAIVALTFIGPRPSPMHHVAHGDGIPGNNALANLRYATPAENEADKVRHGTKFVPRGEHNGHAKLTMAQVQAIRQALRSGRRQLEIASSYGVSQSLIAHIKSGKHWKPNV